MPRLFDVRKPSVDVLYVAPFPLNDDVAHYFAKVLEIGGVEEPQKRYKAVVPENYHRFPAHFSLTLLLLYSPRALRRIANFCRGKAAYIVPNVVGPEELRLSMALGIPLLAPEPRVAAIFGSKSGAKRIFHAAQVNVAPGAHDLYDEEDLLGALAQLISMHLDVPRWMFKLDDEFGGRGHAHVDTKSLSCYQQLLKEHDAAPDEWEEEATQAHVHQRLVAELLEVLPQRAVINMRWLWRTWADYVVAFKRVGGVIEASPLEIRSSPSANLLVEPDGTINLTSVHEQIFSSAYTFVGAALPQTAVPFPALREAAVAVGKACYQRNIIGHVGVDFVSFLDHEGVLRVWAVDLNVRMTHSALTFGFFHFLVKGHFDPHTGLYHATQADDCMVTDMQRSYVMNELLFHPQLFSIRHSVFFNLCRLKGVSFDLQERTGTVFNLMDSFARGVIGILTVGKTLLDALRKFADCLEFIQRQVGLATTKSTTKSHEVLFKDVVKAIKHLVVRVAARSPLSKDYLTRSTTHVRRTRRLDAADYLRCRWSWRSPLWWPQQQLDAPARIEQSTMATSERGVSSDTHQVGCLPNLHSCQEPSVPEVMTSLLLTPSAGVNRVPSPAPHRVRNQVSRIVNPKFQGVVHPWVGQKLLKCNEIKVLSPGPGNPAA